MKDLTHHHPPGGGNPRPPVVEISGLEFARGGQPILQDVDLEVREGEFTALLGPNGGGKTTLMKLILGLLGPDRGSIRVLGRKADGHSRPGRVGYVPQDHQTNPSFPITVRELVLMGRLGISRRRWGWSPEDRSAAETALTRVGLLDRQNSRVGDLSGGQRQRAYIARALVGEPRLLLLDEPTSSVDQEWQGRLFELFRELNRTTTIILVSHDLSAISPYVRSIACVNRQVHFHPSNEITAEILSEVYQCPVELIGHGLPHRVLAEHNHLGGHDD